MTQNTTRLFEHHCTVREQRHLVSEMTQCDTVSEDNESIYECYLEATRESRENKACMYS